MTAAHPLVAEAAALGVTVTARADGLHVAPAAKLTSDLRARLISARSELLAELAANDATDDVTTAERWRRFLDACEQLGLHRDAVAAHFTDDDRRDLLDTYADDDPRLQRCAETLAGGPTLIAESARLRRTERLPVPRSTGTVTCGTCGHFEPSAGAPWLGRCGAGEPVAPAGNYATDARACSRYTDTPAEPLVRECGSCRHVVLSTANPAGGLQGCAVRSDVPMQVARRVRCDRFEVAA